MIRVDLYEEFPLTAMIMDECSGELISSRVVYYNVLDEDDIPLSPPVSGVFDESTTNPGVYKKVLSLYQPGVYYAYATCSGFNAGVEEIIVNPENIYELAKQNRHYNISVEDVPRTTVTPTTSQIMRNVPLNKTDYIITKIKKDDTVDWSDPTVASGIVHAWYRDINDEVPFKMAGPY